MTVYPACAAAMSLRLTKKVIATRLSSTERGGQFGIDCGKLGQMTAAGFFISNSKSAVMSVYIGPKKSYRCNTRVHC